MKKFVFLLITGFLVVSCGNRPETARPQWKEISASVYASGTIKSLHQYQVYPVVSGIIREIYVDDGEQVTAGQLLLRIDNRAQQWSKANAALLAAYSSVRENQDKLDDAGDAVSLSRDKLKNDSLLYFRTKTLFQSGAVSRVELEQRELAYESSRNAHQNSVTRLRDLKRQLDLNAGQAGNNLAISAKNEEDFLIRSDLNGTVYGILREKGELVSPQVPLAVIGSSDQFILEMEVDEYDIVKIDKGQRVFVTLDSYRGKVFEATVTRINPIMNERSKTFTVEAVFRKKPEKLFPNTSFEASIVLAMKPKALVIPKRFLLQDNRVLLSDGTYRKVEVGLSDYEYVEVVKGLKITDELMLPE